MNKVVTYEQMSIYDFIEEKSQEVQPSETVPQVDEAQDDLAKMREEIISFAKSPRSALDTFKSPLCPVCYGYEWRCDHEVYKPTEDTDLTLFSVGEHVTIIGGYTEDDEDYDYLEAYVGKTCWVVSVKEHHSRKQVVTVRLGDSNLEVPFYWDELQK